MKNTKKTVSKTNDLKFLKKEELQRLHKKLKMELKFDPENKKLKKEFDRVNYLVKPKMKPNNMKGFPKKKY
ncbi:hypothetical protein [Flammeovirga pacifica]|uniref:Uncharacterized protein n=1 Tax=Flammeovirga pacifica TaxID=915059 RepID=A0A1S1YTK9_FLAPC|nr:hypothetical protein [Flammeovirga pacifica]OHX64193.1 hypothetical protein NH26_21555 [Flammeovirga pacifica]